MRGEKEQSACIGSRFPPRRCTSGLIARDPELWSARIVQYVRIQPGWEESRAENRVAEEANGKEDVASLLNIGHFQVLSLNHATLLA